ncbi:hypothetical protein CGZ90_05480 [Fictibacillus aquaticus]|uniref:Uncharacterized protein n=1 Tax=Fictibacillus aquaticus TaxID=2021314 RepID=A0A235FDR0_9BACL|nr:hypothetical protein CGZ90_05480 [Fictibacillus aquaticus]
MEIFGLIIVFAIIRWEKNELNLHSFVKELFILSACFILIRLIKSYMVNNWEIPQLPETFEVWIGGFFMFGLACYYSFACWRKFKKKISQ